MPARILCTLFLALLLLNGSAWPVTAWKTVQLDSFVSVQLPAMETKKNPDGSWVAHLDSCVLLAQVSRADHALTPGETRKTLLATYTGIGYYLVKEQFFSAGGQQGITLLLAQNASSIDPTGELRYLHAVYHQKTMYVLSFTTLPGFEKQLAPVREKFFASLAAVFPVEKTAAAPAGRSAKRGSPVLYIGLFTMAFAMLALRIAQRKNKRK